MPKRLEQEIAHIAEAMQCVADGELKVQDLQTQLARVCSRGEATKESVWQRPNIGPNAPDHSTDPFDLFHCSGFLDTVSNVAEGYSALPGSNERSDFRVAFVSEELCFPVGRCGSTTQRDNCVTLQYLTHDLGDLLEQ